LTSGTDQPQEGPGTAATIFNQTEPEIALLTNEQSYFFFYLKEQFLFLHSCLFVVYLAPFKTGNQQNHVSGKIFLTF
jgi:hypothetical protein